MVMNKTARPSFLTWTRALALLTVLGLAWLSTPEASAQLGSLVVTITSPTSGSTVGGTIAVSADVTIIGAITVRGVQFKLDGANLGAEDTSGPYSIPWDTRTASNALSERVTAAGRMESRKPGTGCAPITLSTAIISGTGVSRVSGVASRPTTKVQSAHPLASCRIGDDAETSALDDRHELRGHPGIFVTDASAVPTSLCVNPSLTIAALAERASAFLLLRAAEYGVNVATRVPLPGRTASSRASRCEHPA